MTASSAFVRHTKCQIWNWFDFLDWYSPSTITSFYTNFIFTSWNKWGSNDSPDTHKGENQQILGISRRRDGIENVIEQGEWQFANPEDSKKTDQTNSNCQDCQRQKRNSFEPMFENPFLNGKIPLTRLNLLYWDL